MLSLYPLAPELPGKRRCSLKCSVWAPPPQTSSIRISALLAGEIGILASFLGDWWANYKLGAIMTEVSGKNNGCSHFVYISSPFLPHQYCWGRSLRRQAHQLTPGPLNSSPPPPVLGTWLWLAFPARTQDATLRWWCAVENQGKVYVTEPS